MSDRCPECSGHRGLPRIMHDQDEPRECANEFHKTAAPVIEFPVAPEESQPNVAAQSEPAQPKQVIRKPVCPYCLTEGKIAGGLTDLGPFKVVVVRCGNEECRKIFGIFQPLGMEMMQPPQSGLTH